MIPVKGRSLLPSQGVGALRGLNLQARVRLKFLGAPAVEARAINIEKDHIFLLEVVLYTKKVISLGSA